MFVSPNPEPLGGVWRLHCPIRCGWSVDTEDEGGRSPVVDGQLVEHMSSTHPGTWAAITDPAPWPCDGASTTGKGDIRTR